MMARPPDLHPPVGISPRVDCVFRALLGDPQHTDRLLDFLNAVLGDGPPIVEVTITNPVKILDFLGDKEVVVDVLAVDARGARFQVEMQSRGHAGLKERMLFGWSGLYQRQSGTGRGYGALRPVVSIWLVDENCFRGARDFHHRFAVMSPEEGIILTNHLDLHVLELERWRQGEAWAVSPAIGRWMAFFSEAEQWSEVPAPLQSPVIEDAMMVLQTFRDNQEWNHAYRARLEFQMIQATVEEEHQRELEAAKQEVERERLEKEKERAEKEQAIGRAEAALAEAAQLRALLLRAGISPG